MGSKVITFYSYKGGVGRSMAMANIAMLLSEWNYRTLIIDWDLEAPGLENFYKHYLNIDSVQQKKGLIDLLLLKEKIPDIQVRKIPWDEYITNIPLDKNSKLDIITAGKRGDEYIRNVKQFDYNSFYSKADGGQYLEDLRDYWLDQYDFILIDSRTGLTDSSGICSIHMPDILVLLFTPNEQSFNGIKNVAQKAILGQKQIIYDRFKLRTLPVPSRIEYQETGLLDEWMDRICNQSGEMLEWLPKKEHNLLEHLVTPAQLINQIKIPYRTFYAYGERLAVKERGTTDPQDIGYSYETLAALLANDFQQTDLLINSRDSYVKKAKREDYTDDSEFRNKITREQDEKKNLEKALLEKEKQSKKRSRIATIVFTLLFTGIIFLVMFGRLFLNKPEPQIPINEIPDSLTQKENYLNFIKTYNTAVNQYDADFNLSLIQQYYKLPVMYRDSAAYIKENSEDVIAYKFTRVVKDYYHSLNAENSKPVEFLNDTLSLFGSLVNIPAGVIQKKIDSIKNHGNLLIRIADTTMMTTESDSAGFNIKFIEKGNFLIDKTEEYNDLECAVTIRVGYDFKIHAVTYTQLRGKFISKAGQKTVLEIFICQSNEKQHRQNILNITNMLEKTNRYKIYTRNNFRIPSDPASPYYIKSNEIRYNGADEQNIAAAIQKLIGEKIKIDLRPARTATPNYLSIFLCFDQNNISVPVTDPKQYKNLP